MMMNRRHFIRNTLSAGALALGAGAVLPACRGNLRSELSGADQKENATGILDKTGTTILYYASLAPSGHNSQPWYVKVVGEKKWVIGADPERRLPAVDPQNREVMLSLGSFVETLSIAAGALGYATDIRVTATDPFDEDIMTVRLIKSSTTGYPLKRISSRRTVKQGYLEKELRPEDVRALSEPLKGRFAYFARGSDHAKCILEGAVEYFKVQSLRDAAQKELAQWIRFSDKEALKKRDGLTPDGMEIQGLAGWYVRHFMDKADVMKSSFRQQGIKKTAEMAGEGGGWIIITSPGRSVADLIDTGRRFQRMALQARERMIAIHPMTQFLEEKAGQNMIASNHGPDIIPQFILRVGYLNQYPDPVSLRRPVSWFVRV